MKKLNDGLIVYQESQRDTKRAKLDEAVFFLRENHLRVNKSNIAKTMGVHRNTLNAPYIQTYLLKYDEFTLDSDKTTAQALDNATAEILKLKNKVSKQTLTISHLKQANDKLRLSNHDVEEKYKHLLGQYQKDMENKIIRFQ